MAKIENLTVGTERFQDFAATGFVNVAVTEDNSAEGHGSATASNPGGYPVFITATITFDYSGTSTNSSASWSATITRTRGGAVIASKTGGFSGNGLKDGGPSFQVSDAFAQAGDEYTISYSKAGGGGLGGTITFGGGSISLQFLKK